MEAAAAAASNAGAETPLAASGAKGHCFRNGSMEGLVPSGVGWRVSSSSAAAALQPAWGPAASTVRLGRISPRVHPQHWCSREGRAWWSVQPARRRRRPWARARAGAGAALGISAPIAEACVPAGLLPAAGAGVFGGRAARSERFLSSCWPQRGVGITDSFADVATARLDKMSWG